MQHAEAWKKNTQAVREPASQQVQGDGNGFHCVNLLMFNQKLGMSPAGGLRKMLPPAPRHETRVKAVSLQLSDWAEVTPKMVGFMSSHGAQYCTAGQVG